MFTIHVALNKSEEILKVSISMNKGFFNLNILVNNLWCKISVSSSQLWSRSRASRSKWKYRKCLLHSLDILFPSNQFLSWIKLAFIPRLLNNAESAWRKSGSKYLTPQYSVHVELTHVRVDTVSRGRNTVVVIQFNIILLVCDWDAVRGQV